MDVGVCVRQTVFLANWDKKKKKLITVSNLIFCKLKSPKEKPTSKALRFSPPPFFVNKGYILAVFQWSRVSATFFDTDLCESSCVRQKEMIKSMN